MQKILLGALFVLLVKTNMAQHSFPKNVISLNGFRNPSIGAEYQHRHISVHAGYYVTNFTSGVTTEFIKTGVSYWFLPIDKKEVASSFYAGASYLRGTSRAYKNNNAVAVETGIRWFVWKGVNLRLGVIALASEGKDVKFNPTPGISYSFVFK